MGRRKGNALSQRKQRSAQRAQARWENLFNLIQDKAKAQAEAEAKAQMVNDFNAGVGPAYESQQWAFKRGVKLSGETHKAPFVVIVGYNFPNGTSYLEGVPLTKEVKVKNVYSGGVDLGPHFFSRDLVEVKIS